MRNWHLKWRLHFKGCSRLGLSRLQCVFNSVVWSRCPFLFSFYVLQLTKCPAPFYETAKKRLLEKKKVFFLFTCLGYLNCWECFDFRSCIIIAVVWSFEAFVWQCLSFRRRASTPSTSLSARPTTSSIQRTPCWVISYTCPLFCSYLHVGFYFTIKPFVSLRANACVGFVILKRRMKYAPWSIPTPRMTANFRSSWR